MQIVKIDSGLLHSCMYVVTDKKHALVIDPCKDVGLADEFKIDYLIITHEHYDHISGVNEWKLATKAPLLCSKTCAKNIMDSRKNMSRYFDVFCEMQTWMPTEQLCIEPVDYYCYADMTFQDIMIFNWQEHKVTLQEIPGHSAGSILINIDNNDFFPGDSLLKDCDIELRFPGGSAKKWIETGKDRIAAIPKGARIWPGHFESFVKE